MSIPKTKAKKAFEYAVSNISRLGDTDVFPYPVDNAIFFDMGSKIVDLLGSIDATGLEKSLEAFPLNFDTQLIPAGYFGFRSVTQIDPMWNAYLLGKVLALAPEFEVRRLDPDEESVFSYRYNPDKEAGTLFNREIGWLEYQTRAVKLAESYEFVVSCDISNFYSRIYHHKLENAMQRATKHSGAPSEIIRILTEISGGTSYGLPVGGPASRILSELLLSDIDQLLKTNDIRFARFVDDYYLFASSKEEAYRHLVFLSEKLLRNRGLSLQKAKTKIVSSKEFLATSDFVEETDEKGEAERVLRKFRRVRLHYDPYSLTAEEDYKALRKAVSKFDIVGMLRTELRKTRIHEPTTKKLLTAIKVLQTEIQLGAVRTVLDHFEQLLPVFPKVAMLLKDLVKVGDSAAVEEIFDGIHKLFSETSPVIAVPINVAFAVRVLAFDPSNRTDSLLNSLYKTTNSISLRRDIINIMNHRGSLAWLSDKLRDYSTLSAWERRSLFLASYELTDEGSHWRKKIGKNAYDQIIEKWASHRKNSGVKGLPV